MWMSAKWEGFFYIYCMLILMYLLWWKKNQIILPSDSSIYYTESRRQTYIILFIGTYRFSLYIRWTKTKYSILDLIHVAEMFLCFDKILAFRFSNIDWQFSLNELTFDDILSVMSILYLLNFLNVFLIYSDYWFTFDSSFFHFVFHLCCHIISNPRFSV